MNTKKELRLWLAALLVALLLGSSPVQAVKPALNTHGDMCPSTIDCSGACSVGGTFTASGALVITGSLTAATATFIGPVEVNDATSLTVDSASNALFHADRAANTDEAAILFETAGAVGIAVGTDGDSSENLHIGDDAVFTNKWVTVNATTGDVTLPAGDFEVNGGDITIDSAGNALHHVDRAANTDEAAVIFETAGSAGVVIGTDGDASENFNVGDDAVFTTKYVVINATGLAVGGEAPGVPLDIEESSASTDTYVNVATVGVDSTGDMSDGFGAVLRFQIEDDGDSEHPIASIAGLRDGADNSGELQFRTWATGTPSTAVTVNSDLSAVFAGTIESNGTDVTLDSAGNAAFHADRAANTDEAVVLFETAGAVGMAIGFDGDSSSTLYIGDDAVFTNKWMSVDATGDFTFTQDVAISKTLGVTGDLTGVTATFTGPVAGTTGTFSGAVSGTTGTFSGAVSGTDITGTGTVSGVTATFTGPVSGTTGTFSSSVSGTDGTFTGTVTGVTGTYSGPISGTTGTYSGAVSGTDITGTGTVSGVTATFSGPVAGTTGTFSGAVSGTDLTGTGTVTGVTATFSGPVSGTTGTFSDAVSGTDITGTGTVSGVTATFTGPVSGTTGAFSDAVSGTTGTFSSDVGVSGLFTFSAGVKGHFDTKTADYTATATDVIVAFDTTSCTPTFMLQPAATAGSAKIIIVKDNGGNASVQNITIDGDGSETIDGQATYVLNANWESVTLMSEGTDQWFVIGAYLE